MVRIGLAAFPLLSIVAAQSACAASASETGFPTSKSLVGETIEVCGYQRGALLYSSSESDDQRYTILDLGPLSPFYQGNVCVSATAEWLGCAARSDIDGNVDDRICLDAAVSDYALRVHSVESIRSELVVDDALREDRP